MNYKNLIIIILAIITIIFGIIIVQGYVKNKLSDYKISIKDKTIEEISKAQTSTGNILIWNVKENRTKPMSIYDICGVKP